MAPSTGAAAPPAARQRQQQQGHHHGVPGALPPAEPGRLPPAGPGQPLQPRGQRPHQVRRRPPPEGQASRGALRDVLPELNGFGFSEFGGGGRAIMWLRR